MVKQKKVSKKTVKKSATKKSSKKAASTRGSSESKKASRGTSIAREKPVLDFEAKSASKRQGGRGNRRWLPLTIWLWLIIVVNALVGITYLTGDFSSVFPNSQSYVFYLFGLLSFCNVYFAYLILKWKKIGFYWFTGVALFALLITMAVGGTFADLVLTLVGPLILYLLMKRDWNKFK